MSRFLFVRHTSHDLIGTTIAGRMPGVHLNQSGLTEAEQLAEELASLPIQQIFSGPLERARETAEPLSRRRSVPVQIAPEFDEVNTGDWTGKRFDDLAPRTDWQSWNACRSKSRAPGGESMLEVQLRVVNKLAAIEEQNGLVAIFSHGDVIRAIVAYFLGVPLDLFLRIAIDPGSISFVELYPEWVTVKCVNAAAIDVVRRCVR